MFCLSRCHHSYLFTLLVVIYSLYKTSSNETTETGKFWLSLDLFEFWQSTSLYEHDPLANILATIQDFTHNAIIAILSDHTTWPGIYENFMVER